MLRFALAFALTLVALQTGQAQTYPDRSVTFVVPFAAGGPTDTIARIYADHMSKTLGQQVVVENAAGAGGTIGSGRVAKADKDGYTLLVHNVAPFVTGPVLYDRAQYDPVAGYEPVGAMGDAAQYIVVRKDFPAGTAAEFVAYAKANPGKINFASAGAGSATHLACVLLSRQTGIEMRHVPYRGTGPAVNDLVGGQVDVMCDQALNMISHVQAGSLRALAIAQEKRSAALPDVPTAPEVGLKDFVVTASTALYAPKGTPPAALAKLGEALRAAAQSAEVTKRIRDLASEIPAAERQTPAGLAAYTAAEAQRWAELVRAAGLKAQ